MKKFILIFTLLLIMVSITAEEKTIKWLDNFEEAITASKATNKPILINFTGSDWCVWCHRLEEEVFEKKEFLEYSSANLILFMADFPRHLVLPDEIKKQNTALLQKYEVKGFPTILLINSKEEVIAKTGYREIGVKEYIKHLTDLLNKE